jgi:hypothetical protein
MELSVVDGPRGRRVLLNERPYGGPSSTLGLVTGATPDSATGELRLFFAPIDSGLRLETVASVNGRPDRESAQKTTVGDHDQRQLV